MPKGPCSAWSYRSPLDMCRVNAGTTIVRITATRLIRGLTASFTNGGTYTLRIPEGRRRPLELLKPHLSAAKHRRQLRLCGR